ncbi:MAG TPA: sugar transferase [Candidatus Saccharimonadales bacterium]|nr:sugar transferase [Candidatus Saccharimonadales bacterium]
MAGFFRVPVRREQILLMIGDLCLLAVSLLLAFVIARFAHFNIIFVLDRFTGGSAIYFSTYLLVFYVGQLYDVEGSRRESRSFLYIGILVAVAFIIIATLYYAIPWWRIARRVMAIQAPLVAVIIYLWRNAWHIVSRRFVAPARVLLVGGGEMAGDLVRDLHAGYGQEYRIIGIVDDDPGRLGQAAGDVPVLGNSLQIAEIAAREGVEILVFASGFRSSMNGSLVKHVLDLKTRGIRVYELPTFYMKATGKVPVRFIEDRWLLFGQDFPGLAAEEGRRLKRLLDLGVALLCVVVLSPVMLLIALLVGLTSRGPVLYRQERLGLHRRPYQLLKFRTMKADAERDGPRWASRNDSRTTSVGRFLRRLRLDEIPQFLNVLRGQMSLIGPRPERRHFVELLEKEIPYYDLRFAVRPGLTGWAQVNFPYGNSIEDAHTKLQYDLYYIQERSLALDAVILLKTLQTIMFRPGY